MGLDGDGGGGASKARRASRDPRHHKGALIRNDLLQLRNEMKEKGGTKAEGFHLGMPL